MNACVLLTRKNMVGYNAGITEDIHSFLYLMLYLFQSDVRSDISD